MKGWGGGEKGVWGCGVLRGRSMPLKKLLCLYLDGTLHCG